MDELLNRRGWNIRTVKTYLGEADKVSIPPGPQMQNVTYFSLPRVEIVEETAQWKTQAENLERKREKQRQREQERWERERPTYLEAGELELGSTCRIAIPSFPGMDEVNSESTVHDLAVLERLVQGLWKALIYKVQGRGEERLTFSLFAFSKELVSVNIDGEATDEEIRATYPFLIPTWEPALSEKDPEAAFRAVEKERIPWERVWGPRRISFRLLAILNASDPEETIEFLVEMENLFRTTRRKRKNTSYNTFIREGHHLLSGGCAVPAGGAQGLQGIFVHRNDAGFIDGIWIDLDFSGEMD